MFSVLVGPGWLAFFEARFSSFIARIHAQGIFGPLSLDLVTHK